MASIPAAGGFSLSSAISFVGQVGVSYTLNRFLAPDGPRLSDLSVSGGDYGVPMARVYGDNVRLPTAFIAQAEIKETKHSTDNTTGIVIGAVSGAAEGFAMGGPVGAAIGAVLGGLLGSKKHHYYTYSDTFGALIADRTADDPIEGVTKIWAAGRVLFDSSQQSATAEVLDGGQLVSRSYGQNRYFKSLTIYGGGLVQTADPVLTSTVGPQPGYRRTAYIVIEDLQLKDFGNSVPSPIDVLVTAKTGQTLAEVAEAICGAAGIDTAHNLSTTALAGQVMRGFAVTQETSCWDALSPLMPVFKVDAGDVCGQIRFYGRERGLRATIPLSAMGAYSDGGQAPDRVKYVRSSDIGLPRETALTFIDPARDYQPNTATSRRSEGDAKSNVSSKLNLTLTADEGATAAATLHWDAWLGRTAVQTTFTDAWNGLSPGFCFGVPFDIAGEAVVLPYRLTRKTRGANGLIEAELVSAENVVVQGVTVGAAVAVSGDDDTGLPDTRAVLIDMPMLQDAHDDFGFYAVLGSDKGYWDQGRVDFSPDGGTTWGTLVDGTEMTAVGDVTGTLAAGTTTGFDDTLDTDTVLTVVVLNDDIVLSSTSDTELDAWANLAFVGKDGQGEYLQFKTATKVDTATWELTNLRRGRRGTDWAIATHVAGEEFALLSDGGVYRLPFTNSDSWGTEFSVRAVTLHQDEANAAVQTFTNTGEGKRPFSPIELEGSFDGSDNLNLVWSDRSRFYGTDTDTPVTFEIDFQLSGSVVRTETITPDEDYSYLAADQVSDGFTEGDAVVVDLFRVNADYGRSRARTAAFLKPAFTLHMEDGSTPILMEDDLTQLDWDKHMSKISDFTPLTGAGVDSANDVLPIVDDSETGTDRNKSITVAELLGLVPAGGDMLAANNLSDLDSAATARTNLDVYSTSQVDAAITAGGGYTPGGTDVAVADGGTGASTASGARTNLGLHVQEWAPNFTSDGDVYIPADEAMTIAQGNAAIGTGTLTFEKSTAAAPSTFSSTTLPATLEAGAWLHVNAASVSGFCATHLVRSA